MNTSPYEQLCEIVGTSHVLDNEAQRCFYSQDIYTRSIIADYVIQPQSTDELTRAVACATSAGYAVIGRGGGMSYTGGYTPVTERSVIVDMSRMNRIIEINAEDMYVTVEAGCTWKSLHNALQETGLRTPFWGPLSGIKATVGGSISQNTVYWGAGLYGASADSLSAMQVVLADGTLIHTGSAAHQNGSPFYRYYGPDLNGLFSCDCGALGIKATVTLKLLPRLPAIRHVSYDFANVEDQVGAMSDIARANLVAQMFGTDPGLGAVRAHRESLLKDMKQLGGVMKSADSVLDALKSGARVAANGRSFLLESSFPVHANIEERNDAAADACMQEFAAICTRHHGKSIPSSVPEILYANPFNPLNNIVGPQGERWVPVHALLPHSRVPRVVQLARDIFAANQSALDQHDIVTGFLHTTASTNCFFMEPLFFWPDELNELHRDSVEQDVLRHQRGFPENLPAREIVGAIRDELIGMFNREGASHLQVGKAYHYAEGLRPDTIKLIRQIKRVVDPGNMVNPGCLGI